jgi:hypothetical protein
VEATWGPPRSPLPPLNPARGWSCTNVQQTVVFLMYVLVIVFAVTCRKRSIRYRGNSDVTIIIPMHQFDFLIGLCDSIQ